MSRLAFAVVGGVAAQSFTSCNTDGAHLTNMVVTVSPDPPVVGQEVTFTIEGTLDKTIQSGSASISVKAGPITFPLTVPFQSNADPIGSPNTPMKAVLGPFTYPNLNVPLIKTTTGKIEIVDENAEQVSCMEFSLPAYSATAPPSPQFLDIDCSDSSSWHMKNLQFDVEPPTIQKGVPFTVNTKGDTDEEISSGKAAVNVDLSLFKLGLEIPFSISPSTPAITGGDMTIGPLTMPKIPLIPDAKGSIKLSEQNAETLACFNFDLPVMAEAIAV
jgi:hypothetical protein